MGFKVWGLGFGKWWGPPGLCYTLEEWREVAQQFDLRAVEQAGEERRNEDQQKAAAKAKPYQVQPEQTAS